jgi:hypothetical protein
MDIDQFLDKELQEDKSAPIEQTKTPESGPDKNFESEKDDVKQYFDLWKKIAETKFEWNPELYSELDKAAAKVKNSLSSSLLTVDSKKIAIKRLIGKALRELRNKNYEAATRIYSDISDIRNKFPDFLLEEKKEINKEIFKLYETLHDEVDSKFIGDFKVSMGKINGLIRDAFSSLEIDPGKSKNFYEKALDIYKELPNGFMSQKLELGKQLLILYKDLSIQTQIGQLQKRLSKGTEFKHVSSDDRLMKLSQIIKKRHTEKSPLLSQNPTLIPGLIERKLTRAKINLQKGLYLEAKKNINAILKVDPGNTEAHELWNSLPIEY